jgi:hypothetical protein
MYTHYTQMTVRMLHICSFRHSELPIINDVRKKHVAKWLQYGHEINAYASMSSYTEFHEHEGEESFRF